MNGNTAVQEADHGITCTAQTEDRARAEDAPLRTAAHRQLDLALDNACLQGMTSSEYRIAIRSLASLFLEAHGVTMQEEVDDNA